MPKDVLGPEWGNLAGLPAEKALEYVAKYAQDLESKVNKSQRTPSGGEDVDEDDEPKVPDSLDIARGFNRQAKAPLGAEFVGRRESARRQARSQIEALGYNWGVVEGTVEDAMSGTTPDQQTNPQAWVAAFVYAHGQADIMKRAQNVKDGKGAEGDDPSPPRNEYEEDVVRLGGMNSDRGNRFPVDQSKRNKIEDPTERRTKSQFEKVLGYKIPDEEWIALQDPEMIKTEADWEEFQATRRK